MPSPGILRHHQALHVITRYYMQTLAITQDTGLTRSMIHQDQILITRGYKIRDFTT